MPSNEKAPGLKLRRNRVGTFRAYWVARPDLVKLGYRPKTVRLHYDPENPSDAPLLAAACRRFQSEMLAWAAGHKQDYRRFDGTLGSLIRLYQTDEGSRIVTLNGTPSAPMTTFFQSWKKRSEGGHSRP